MAIDEEALIYDVNATYKSSPKSGWSVKRQKEEAAATAWWELLPPTMQRRSIAK